MSFLFWSAQPENSQPPRYNLKNQFIVTYNISGTIFNFSYITLSKQIYTNLYNYAYTMPSNELVLDKDNFIYLDLSPEVFQYIHDYIKGYDIRIQNLDIKTKEMILRDAKILKITPLIDMITLELPTQSNDVLNKWANIIASTLTHTGVNIEKMVESCTGKELPYPLSQKIRHLFETNINIRNKLKQCVKNTLEVQYTGKNTPDSLLLQLIMELSKDVSFQEIIEKILIDYL